MGEKINKHIESQPVSVQGIYQRAFNGSKANAIKAKCLDCTLNQRDEIKNCTVKLCPLWNVRPYQAK